MVLEKVIVKVKNINQKIFVMLQKKIVRLLYMLIGKKEIEFTSLKQEQRELQILYYLLVEKNMV